MRFPEAVRRPGAEAAYALTVPAELLAFQGHFPGDPILPGVVQVDWAIHFGGLAFGALGCFCGIEQLKFMEVIRPDEAIELRLAHDPAKGELRFAFHGERGRKSSGSIRFEPGRD